MSTKYIAPAALAAAALLCAPSGGAQVQYVDNPNLCAETTLYEIWYCESDIHAPAWTYNWILPSLGTKPGTNEPWFPLRFIDVRGANYEKWQRHVECEPVPRDPQNPNAAVVAHARVRLNIQQLGRYWQQDQVECLSDNYPIVSYVPDWECVLAYIVGGYCNGVWIPPSWLYGYNW